MLDAEIAEKIFHCRLKLVFKALLEGIDPFIIFNKPDII